ncbi:MAG: transglycosylase SLT domain-containing protein [Hyphomicrobiaceae bacterium]|nr:transglycosylase SLT domain-containing protein [Hyphomicrobiaceae bacterium]
MMLVQLLHLTFDCIAGRKRVSNVRCAALASGPRAIALTLAGFLVGTLAFAASAQTGPAGKDAKSPASSTAGVPAAPVAKPKSTSAASDAVPTATEPVETKLPRTLSPPPAEAAYRAKVRAMIEPLLGNPPSADEVKQIKDALKARSPGTLADPVARKLVEWQALKAGIGSPDDFTRFIAANPAWPDSQLLARRAEEQLFTRGGSSAEIRAFFKGREPASGAGYAALASAHLAEGDEGNARRFAVRAWTTEEMAGSLEAGFLERFGKLLTVADHKRRLDRVLIDRLRFNAERRERAAFARRVIPLLPEADRKAAEARLAVFLKDRSSAKLLAALPSPPEGAIDWGLAYARAVAHLEGNRLDEAARILTALPNDAEALVSPDDWWLARREAAYMALKAGKPQLAYDLVKQPTPLSENPAKEQAHMAGWIAMRLLKSTDVALKHFEAHRAAADGPLSRARANYWAGRALEALGRKADAKARYTEATKDVDTFHGLLARLKLEGRASGELAVAPPALPTTAEASRFLTLDVVRAAVLARRAGLDRNMPIGLFAAARNHLKTEGELALLAELALALDDPQTALRVGKAAIARGLNLVLYAYPVDAFPVFKPLGVPPETALLLAVARQETEFNNSIVSTAGARGLLQVMPVTAKHVCTDYKIKCDIPRLLTDDAYNAMIASAYIGDRMRELGGWYVVALPAYNAGPGRARQWIREYGDPRGANVDPIDWIEMIPIEETRLYAQKVLANLQIYRARLGDPRPLRLVEDLHKPTGVRKTAQ